MLKSHHIQIPFSEPRPGNDAKYTLAYSRPVNVNVVGSFARKTAIQVGERLAIDLAVTMPSVVPPHLPLYLIANNLTTSLYSKIKTILIIDISTREHTTWHA